MKDTSPPTPPDSDALHSPTLLVFIALVKHLGVHKIRSSRRLGPLLALTVS